MGVTGQPEPDLTAIERRVLELLAAGNTNREIASELGLSPNEVRAHFESFLEKFGAQYSDGMDEAQLLEHLRLEHGAKYRHRRTPSFRDLQRAHGLNHLLHHRRLSTQPTASSSG